MDKLLTVIVPVFNDEANIMRCLESLFNQTFCSMEIIVVNDASTDNTLMVLEKYQKRIRRDIWHKGLACLNSENDHTEVPPFFWF